MYETLIEYHKILLKENLKAAPDKSYFMLKKVKFLGHIIEDKKVKPLTSKIDGFQKLEPPTSMKALQRYLGTINFLAKYVYSMQPILQPLFKPPTQRKRFQMDKRTSTNIWTNEKNNSTQIRTNNARYYKTIPYYHRCIKHRHRSSIITTTSNWKKNRLFTPIKMRLSTLIRECSDYANHAKKHANHKQTPREPEMPFKTLVDKIDQMDLTRTITNNHKNNMKSNKLQLTLVKISNKWT